MVSAGRVTDRVVKGGVGPPDEDIPLTAFMNGINRACSNHKTQNNTHRFTLLTCRGQNGLKLNYSLALIKCTLDMDLDL